MNSLSQALLSLEGLSIGDAFGQCFFQPSFSDQHLVNQSLPEAPWYFTDDTEMSLSVVDVLAKYGEIDQDALAKSLALHYSYDRAYGPSMHRVLERIRCGEHWRDVASSSFEGQGSWGNGAAMRAAPLGAFFASDLSVAAAQAALSAEVTHAHPEGIAGAVAVAIAAAQATRFAGAGRLPSHQEFLDSVIGLLAPSEVRSKLARAQSIRSAESVQFAVSILGNGTGMSAQDTVPFALWCCSQRLTRYEDAMWLAVSGGGDRDTICAIVGGVVASFVGSDGIPAAWRSRRETLPAWHADAQPSHRAGA
ncbi:ADP-ribosylglycohydrolase family protein [Caldimonas brevitalea]|uniref:ADP-ribosylglycohydrolase family protein n=1 Tax=Caldimonas brevitalea TaxID=413882 RepID=UPI0009F91ADB|nr:ADP-ribosylglycohydrolase family protein [Caldimonas brevitalea]